MSPEQERTLAGVIAGLAPGQAARPRTVDHQAVTELIDDWYGITLTPQGGGPVFARRWGFAPQKSAWRAVEQDQSSDRWGNRPTPAR